MSMLRINHANADNFAGDATVRQQGNDRQAEGIILQVVQRSRVSDAPHYQRAGRTSALPADNADLGVATIRNSNHLTETTIPPRVQTQDVSSLVPHASPDVDNENYRIARTLDSEPATADRLVAQSAEYSLKEMVKDFCEQYGESCPFRTLSELQQYTVNGKPFMQLLQAAVRKSDRYVTGAELRAAAENILKPDMGRTFLVNCLSQKAEAMGIHLSRRLQEHALAHIINGFLEAGGGNDAADFLKDLTPARAEEMLARVSNLDDILNCYGAFPDVKSALTGSLEQKCREMGLRNLRPDTLETIARTVYEAVNASLSKNGAEPLPNLTDKCDASFVTDMINGRVENLDEILRYHDNADAQKTLIALKTGLQTGNMPSEYATVLTRMLDDLQDCKVEGLPKDIASLLDMPSNGKTVRGVLLDILDSNGPIASFEMRNLLWKPLIEAFVLPKYDIIPEDKIEQWANDNYGAHMNTFTEDQKKSIAYYKSAGFVKINDFLRGYTKTLVSRIKNHFDNLQSVFAKQKENQENVVLYRGDNTQQWFNNAIGNAEWHTTEGTTITLDKAFLSSSMKRETAEQFAKRKTGENNTNGIVYKILYPKGVKSALYIDTLEHINVNEREMLFKPGARFKILTTDKNAGEVTLLALNDE